MFVHGKLAEALKLIELAKQGVRPVSNYYAAYKLLGGK
jgi:hypothetical protein